MDAYMDIYLDVHDPLHRAYDLHDAAEHRPCTHKSRQFRNSNTR